MNLRTRLFSSLAATSFAILAMARNTTTPLSNHADAVACLSAIELSLGDAFDPNTPSVDIQPLKDYLTATPADVEVRDGLLALARTWSNVEALNTELETTRPMNGDHRAMRRAGFAWDVLFTYGVLSNRMDYVQAVRVLGKPEGHSDAFAVPTTVKWLVRHRVITPTYIAGTVFTNGVLEIRTRSH